MQRNLIYIVFLTIFLTLGNLKAYSQDLTKKKKSFASKNQTDKPKPATETKLKVTDTIKLDSIKNKKPLLESKIKRKAVDYEKFDQKKKLITLYNQ